MGFLSDIVEMEPILQQLSARGIPIDDAARLKLREGLDAEMKALFARMQDLVPLELRNVEPKEGYVRGVKIQPGRIEEDGSGGYRWFDPGDEDSPAMWWPMMEREFCAEDEKVLAVSSLGLVTRWCRVLPFRPSGGPKGQVLRYARHRGYAIPKSKKEDKETSDKAGLEALCKKHPKDELLPAIRSYRDVEKLKSTYVDGWKPGRDGRVHPEFTNKPATGQLSSHSPNAQQVFNPDKSPKMSSLFRPIIRAAHGHTLVEFDWKSFHVLTTGFEARDPDWMRLGRLDMHSYVAGILLGAWKPDIKSEPDDALLERFKWLKSDPQRKATRNGKAKPCIAEGQLVLTDVGLIPIEKVVTGHRVWDGVEWTAHGGVICLGEKEVMTYNGLTATPDHEVFTATAEQIPFGEAASRMVRLEETGFAGQPVRTGHHHFSRFDEDQRLSLFEVPLLEMFSGEVHQHGQSAEGNDGRLSELRSTQIDPSDYFGQALRRNPIEMRQSQESQIQGLRWSGNSLLVLVSGRIRKMGRSEFAAWKLSGSGNRQNQQRRELRAREFETSDSPGANAQQTRQCVAPMEGQENPLDGVRQPLHLHLDEAAGHEGDDWRRDHRACEGHGSEGSLEVLEKAPVLAHRARVYDIINAGPRHRYTVSGKLVGNCILGVGFGMQAHRLWKENEETIQNKAEAQKLLDLLHDLFPKVFKWQDEIRELAHRQNYLISRHGWMRWFWDVKRWSSEKGDWIHGDDSEKAIAFLPANDAHCMLKAALIRLEHRDLLKGYGLINTVHDSLLFECPTGLVDECAATVREEMERPSSVLVDPLVAPEGLSVEVEIKTGPTWQEMTEYRFPAANVLIPRAIPQVTPLFPPLQPTGA